MKAKKIIGVVMMAIFWAGLFVGVARDYGIAEAAFVFSTALAAAAFVCVGMYMIMDT